MDQMSLLAKLFLNIAPKMHPQKEIKKEIAFSLEKSQLNENTYCQLNIFIKNIGSVGDSLRKMYHFVT